MVTEYFITGSNIYENKKIALIQFIVAVAVTFTLISLLTFKLEQNNLMNAVSSQINKFKELNTLFEIQFRHAVRDNKKA